MTYLDIALPTLRDERTYPNVKANNVFLGRINFLTLLEFIILYIIF